MNNVDTAVEQEIQSLLDAYERSPTLRSDLRLLLRVHEDGKAFQKNLDTYARRECARTLLQALSEEVTSIGVNEVTNWFIRVMNRQEVPHTRENEALLGSAFENFKDALTYLGITPEWVRQQLAGRSPSDAVDPRVDQE